MTTAIPPQPLSPPQLAVIQAPPERGLPARMPPQPAQARMPAAAPTATGRGRIIDIVC